MADEVASQVDLRVDQCLHGYADGHRLLSSSRRISSLDAKLLLKFSDASGPGMVAGEDGYITGYPLPESGAYALARTWNASEMPRPGCVWTHTLLIDFSDLARLYDLRRLNVLFRRPRGIDDTAFCKEPLRLDEDNRADINRDMRFHAHEDLTSPFFRRSAASLTNAQVAEPGSLRILHALYAYPHDSIISSSVPASQRDALVLDIWSQQWPRLRRNFRFCSLAFSDRSDGDVRFDLQLLTDKKPNVRSRFPRVRDESEGDHVNHLWLLPAWGDLHDGGLTEFRQFLRIGGSDTTSGRESFAPLCELFGCMLLCRSHPEVFDAAVNLLDGPLARSNGRAAKSAFIDFMATNADSLRSKDIQYLLKNVEALEPKRAAELTDRLAAAAWRSDPLFVVDMTDDESNRAVAFAALRSANVSEILDSLSHRENAILRVLEFRPDLLESSGLWSLPGQWKTRAIELLPNRPSAFAPALEAILSQPSKELAQCVRKVLGPTAAFKALVDRLQNDPPAIGATRIWLEHACGGAEIAKGLIDERLATAGDIEMIMLATDPDFVPNEYGDDPWATWAAKLETRDAKMPTRAAAYLFGRALGYRSRSQAELIAASFDVLYDAAKRSELPDDCASLFIGRLAWIPSTKRWDMCSWLRTTVVETFIGRGLAVRTFLSVTAHDVVFRQMTAEAEKSWSGRKFLKLVKKINADGNDFIRRRKLSVENVL